MSASRGALALDRDDATSITHHDKSDRRRAVSLALVQSRALLGLDAPAVTVEVHLAKTPSPTCHRYAGSSAIVCPLARDRRQVRPQVPLHLMFVVA